MRFAPKRKAAGAAEAGAPLKQAKTTPTAADAEAEQAAQRAAERAAKELSVTVV